MEAQFVVEFAVAVFAVGYLTAESFVRSARRRDAVRVARAHGGAYLRRGPVRPAPEVDRPDEKAEERHDPRPVTAR